MMFSEEFKSELRAMVLPKSMRLKGYRCFYYLHKYGVRFHGPSMVLRVVEAKRNLLKNSYRDLKLESCRCAIAISSKVSKKAVIRNQIRRSLHDHLNQRLSKKTQFANSWALFSLKPNSSSIHQRSLLLEECDLLLRKAGLFE